MAIVSSLFIRWGVTKFIFRAYIVQFDGDSNLVALYIYIYIYIYIKLERCLRYA